MLRPQLTVEFREGFVLVPPGVDLLLQLVDQFILGSQLRSNVNGRAVKFLLESFDPLKAQVP